MFESLDEHMKHDADLEVSPRERVIRWVAILIVSLLVFGGLYFGVRLAG